MTLVETLIVALVLGLVLFVVSRLMEITRNELKAARTWEVLGLLDEALSAYHSVAEAWPAVEAAGPDRQKTADASGSRRAAASFSSIDEGRRPESGLESARLVLAALEAVPESRAVLERVPAMLRADVGELARRGDGETERQGDQGTRGQAEVGLPTARPVTTDNPQPSTHNPLVLDGWGRPLRCLTSSSRLAGDRRAVAAGGGRPIFISVGPDGLFGPEDSPAVGDNLRSDELPRNTVMSHE